VILEYTGKLKILSKGTVIIKKLEITINNKQARSQILVGKNDQKLIKQREYLTSQLHA
jgi:hypothetical protein